MFGVAHFSLWSLFLLASLTVRARCAALALACCVQVFVLGMMMMLNEKNEKQKAKNKFIKRIIMIWSLVLSCVRMRDMEIFVSNQFHECRHL